MNYPLRFEAEERDESPVRPVLSPASMAVAGD